MTNTAWLERKYILLFSSSVDNFKKKDDNLFNCSCPYCDDNKNTKYKARGYIFDVGQQYNYYCHHCSKSTTFINMMKDKSPSLYKQYIFERFNQEKQPEYVEPASIKIDNDQDIRGILPSVKMLPDEHQAKKYLASRKIPVEKWSNLFYTENLDVLKTVFPKYQNHRFHIEPRLVIPIYNENSILIGCACRAIHSSKLRYINLKKEDTSPLIFNINNIDFSKRILVLEGAMDAMFFDNAIAVDGSDFKKASDIITKEKDVLVYDNTPRNLELISKMIKMSAEGYRMVIWPDNVKEKDVNEMVLSGIDYLNIIENNIYSGLSLKLKLANWSKANL